MTISVNLYNEFDKKFDQDRKNYVAMQAVSNNGLLASMKNSEVIRKDTFQFSCLIPQKGITNQKNSGRCWLFAATNCLRYEMMKKYKLEEFELSQNWLIFHDKFERANFFLESIFETFDEPADSRLMAHLLDCPVMDGGQWDMFCNIVNKYGLVPKTAMPETACSSGTAEMNRTITEKLRQCACILRKEHKAGKSDAELQNIKEKTMEDVYRVLCICLGKPPRTFDFEIRNNDGEYITAYGITPMEFYKKFVGVDVNDYVSVINAPTEDKPFYKSYTVSYLGNVKEAGGVRYLNLPIEDLKKLAAAQMDDGHPVWFGCDVGKRKIRQEGIMDTEAYLFEDFLGLDMEMTKAERLDYGESAMDHAMVFQGYNRTPEGKINRWRVENSWGTDVGSKGYYLMTDEWFDEYMYQIVVNRKYLTEEQLAWYNEEPKVLKPWDPMGTLAYME